MEAFVITLREGIEVALILSIFILTLRSLKREKMLCWVWWGSIAALLASLLIGGIFFRLYAVNEELWEGVLYLLGALVLFTMIFWMHKHSQRLSQDIREKVSQFQGSWKDGWLLFGLAFVLLLREGVELVLFLSMLQISTKGLISFLGMALAILLSILFGVSFVQGVFPFRLRRFFQITQWILVVFLLQLLLHGYHELAEAGWAPANRTSMALVGPLVRQSSIFLLIACALPFFLWWSSSSLPEEMEGTDVESLSRAEKRLYRARLRKYRLCRYGAFVLMFFFLGFAATLYAQEVLGNERPEPKAAEVKNKMVRIPIGELKDKRLHHYGVLRKGYLVRFLAIQTSDGRIRVALDACEICGPKGYIQDGIAITCLNCSGEINPLSLGLQGGCNPIPLPFKVQKGWVLIPLSVLDKEAHRFEETSLFETICPVCQMKISVKEATSFVTYKGKNYYFCSMEYCRSHFLKNPEKYLQ